MGDDPIIQAPDIAEMCGVSVSTVRYWDHAGTGPRSFKLGRRRVWRKSVVLAWIAEQEAAG